MTCTNSCCPVISGCEVLRHVSRQHSCLHLHNSDSTSTTSVDGLVYSLPCHSSNAWNLGYTPIRIATQPYHMRSQSKTRTPEKLEGCHIMLIASVRGAAIWKERSLLNIGLTLSKSCITSKWTHCLKQSKLCLARSSKHQSRPEHFKRCHASFMVWAPQYPKPGK